jgi:hypothetical protein
MDNSSFIEVSHTLIGRAVVFGRRGLVVQNLVDLFQDFGSKFLVNFQGLQVLLHLFLAGGSGDAGAHVGVGEGLHRNINTPPSSSLPPPSLGY